jgi:hypothetical protein
VIKSETSYTEVINKNLRPGAKHFSISDLPITHKSVRPRNEEAWHGEMIRFAKMSM